MNTQVKKQDSILILSPSEEGKTVEDIFRFFLKEDDLSGLIFFEYSLDQMLDSCGILPELLIVAEERNKLVVMVSEKKIENELAEEGLEELLVLPTLHEAKEAVFMHELEMQFKDEMGDEFDM